MTTIHTIANPRPTPAQQATLFLHIFLGLKPYTISKRIDIKLPHIIFKHEVLENGFKSSSQKHANWYSFTSISIKPPWEAITFL